MMAAAERRGYRCGISMLPRGLAYAMLLKKDPARETLDAHYTRHGAPPGPELAPHSMPTAFFGDIP